MINHEFSQWATGFSGCDGGNPKGSVWVCGLEFSGRETEESLVFNDVVTPCCVGHPYWESREEFLHSQYNRKAIKLLAAMAERSTVDCASFFREHSCFDRDSNYFKLNLYPIVFPTTSHSRWTDWLIRKTGFATNKEYLNWCVENRFPVLRKWVLEYSPKLVLCTGITYAKQFQSAFGLGDEEVYTGEAAGKKIIYFHTNDGNTTVAIIYFLGTRYGLKSDAALSLTGKRLTELLTIQSQTLASIPSQRRI